jgi:arginine decarboxylase
MKEERMRKTITMAAATAGHAEGGTALNAFDNALLAAGIGNVNLIKVSSIIPPDVDVIELPKLKPGALVPTAYAAITSEAPGEVIAAAVGYALPDDPARPGVIMEYHDVADGHTAETSVRQMLTEAFAIRGEVIRELKVMVAEHVVERRGCAVAAVVLLSDDHLA